MNVQFSLIVYVRSGYVPGYVCGISLSRSSGHMCCSRQGGDWGGEGVAGAGPAQMTAPG